jgi:hypothetical protein
MKNKKTLIVLIWFIFTTSVSYLIYNQKNKSEDEIWFKIGYEEGEWEGMQDFENGSTAGYEDGKSEGYDSTYSKSFDKGFKIGYRSAQPIDLSVLNIKK